MVLLFAGGLAALSPEPARAGEEGDRIHVEKIVIRGVKNRDSAIKSQMRIREGEDYAPDEFQQLLNTDTSHLFRWGIWIRRILPKVPRGKITLVLEVEDRIRLSSISFEDMDAFEEEEILPLLLVKPNMPTDLALIRLAADQIEKYYRDQGYRFAHVSVDLKGSAHGRRQLVFQVDEGPRTRIVDILFHGNRSIRAGRLRSVMETKRSDLFQAERLEEAKFRRDLAALEQYYREEGWRDACVTLEDLVYSDNRSRLTILIRVNEGQRYVVDSVKIEGNTAIPTEEIERKVRLRPGMYYRANLIYGNVEEEEKGDFRRIRDAYGEKGYLFPVIIPVETFDVKAKRVKVAYHIKEGNKIRIRCVKIRGNYKTRDDVIRRFLHIRPGEIPNPSDFEFTQKRLMQTQFFGKVNLKFDDTGDPETKDALIELDETRTGDIRFIAAYNQSTQFMGRIAVRFKNFDLGRLPRSFSDLFSGRAFAGGGQTLTLQVTAGMESQLIYNLRFDEPHFFGTRTSFMLNLFSYQRDWGPYLEKRLGAHIMFGRKITRFLSATLKYRVEGLELRDISLYAAPDVWAARGPDTISALIAALNLDLAERDPFGQPYSGFEAGWSYEYAGGFLLGTVDFMKCEANATIYTTLFGEVSKWRHIVKLKAQAGWCASHHHAPDVPIYERFYLGGLGTVRGFSYRSIGPDHLGEPIGGNFRTAATLEYSLPLYRAPMPGFWQQEIDVLRMIFFYDVGVLSEDFGAFSTRDFRSGVGFGFRLRVPALGGIPIALDFGWPISRRPGDRTERVSFSLGFFFF